MNTEEKNIMIRRLREADSEAVVEVGDKGVDTVEGERSSNAASRNGHQIFFLKLPLEGESPKKMRFLLAKAVKHIAANPPIKIYGDIHGQKLNGPKNQPDEVEAKLFKESWKRQLRS
ncbi:Uncharacterized protein Rs2_36410 [Raphanus sativus]|nr:Uncharacterized protein Rs2_36410 [Raphanus sativus]